MPEKSPLSDFCTARGISDRIKMSFGMYIRSVYADKFRMNPNGETVHIIMNRLSQDDLEAAWMDFVKELAKHISSNE